MTPRPLLLTFLLVGCGTAATDTPTDDTDASAACVVLSDGPWTANGTCFGMRMTTTLTMDASGCTFTLTGWDMEMGTPNPTGGEVADHTVSLDGDAWSTCTAQAAGPRRVTGTCEAGCAFELSHD